jgi:hypothetical protein
LEAVKKRWSWLKHLFADSAYDRAVLMDKAALPDFVVEVVRRRARRRIEALIGQELQELYYGRNLHAEI